MEKKSILVVAQAVLVSAAIAGVSNVPGAQFPVRVFRANGCVAAAEAGMRPDDGKSVTLAWKVGGEQPVVAYDYGGRTVGGYAVFKVTGFKAQGKDADGRDVGFPVLRLSYSTHPDGLRATGDFTRRGCADYLGQFFDNPVLPANVNRFELRTNPHFPSAAGLMLRAADADDGIVVSVSQPACVRIVSRRKGVNTELCRKILDEPVIDGVLHRLEAKVAVVPHSPPTRMPSRTNGSR